MSPTTLVSQTGSILGKYAIPILLLVATVLTTTASGARFMQNFLAGLPPIARDADLWPWSWLAHHPALFATGLPFSASLLGILLIHEFGHFFACRWHRIRTTLPWVLPAPTLSGTAGAVIQIRSTIPTRNALMDVGIYGPLAGYLATSIALAFGFALSYPIPANAPESIVQFGGEPLTLHLVHALVARWNPAIPSFDRLTPHPILLAGWIGLLITALNLIPGGQLDGGHILHAISPRLHRISTRILPFALVLAGIFYWAGWIVWGLILLLPAMRRRRPPINTTLSPSRVLLGISGLTIFLLTFTLTPFHGNSLQDFIHAFSPQ
jgi:membrane-associated protease RseP (regulator of RpoE activity)